MRTHDFLEQDFLLGLTVKQTVLMVAIIALLAGIILLIFAYYSYNAQKAFIANAIHANGTVTEIILHKTTSKDGHDTYAPVISFEDAQGREHVFESNKNTSKPVHKIGQTVYIIYDPQKPSKAEINEVAALWLYPIMFGGIGTTIAAPTRRCHNINHILRAFPVPIMCNTKTI